MVDKTKPLRGAGSAFCGRGLTFGEPWIVVREGGWGATYMPPARAADEGFMLSDKKKLEIASLIKALRSGAQRRAGVSRVLLTGSGLIPRVSVGEVSCVDIGCYRCTVTFCRSGVLWGK